MDEIVVRVRVRWRCRLINALPALCDQRRARARSSDPDGRLLAISDVFDDWFQRDDFEACTFITVLLEMGVDHPLGRACAAHLATICELVGGLATKAGVADPDEFARFWHILMKGCIVQEAAGD